MISLHYSWWLFHKINQKSFKQDIGHKVRTISRFMDTMLKNKVVHLSTIHGKAFEIPPIFFQQENCKFFIAKGNSSSYNTSSPVLLGKKALLLSTLPTFIQKGKMVGLPNLLLSQRFISQKAFTKLLNYYKVDRSFMRRVPPGYLRTFSTLLLQQQCLQMRMAPGTECWFRTFQLGSWWPRSLLGSTEADLLETAC